MTRPRSLGGRRRAWSRITPPLAPRWETVRRRRQPGPCASPSRQRAGGRGWTGGEALEPRPPANPAQLGDLDRVWLGLHPRNKGGCRRLYLGRRGRRGGVATALGPVGDLDGREARNLGPESPAGFPPSLPPTPREVTSHLGMGTGCSWGGVGWGGGDRLGGDIPRGGDRESQKPQAPGSCPCLAAGPAHSGGLQPGGT